MSLLLIVIGCAAFAGSGFLGMWLDSHSGQDMVGPKYWAIGAVGSAIFWVCLGVVKLGGV